ncbi:Uncharacterized protein OBRU01_17684 [Operophtera brumata]|uniref:E2 ubiquitin-conjugating enzyme n=1 Tax=Operophtera brumata TaxID=104452 RepID=A0A0L7L1Y7_OPEBR|nr:Uncharacterized protein OBRU01_17684 [Operophtera brumata]
MQREIKEMKLDPPPNCKAAPKGDNLYEWTATILGITGSVYEGGVFHLDILLPISYPFDPPMVRFVTKIYHCNVSRSGKICLDTLYDEWSPALSISKVLLSISLLMNQCNPYSPLEAKIGKLYLLNRKEHDYQARLWTKRYALHKRIALHCIALHYILIIIST